MSIGRRTKDLNRYDNEVPLRRRPVLNTLNYDAAQKLTFDHIWRNLGSSERCKEDAGSMSNDLRLSGRTLDACPVHVPRITGCRDLLQIPA